MESGLTTALLILVGVIAIVGVPLLEISFKKRFRKGYRFLIAPETGDSYLNVIRLLDHANVRYMSEGHFLAEDPNVYSPRKVPVWIHKEDFDVAAKALQR